MKKTIKRYRQIISEKEEICKQWKDHKHSTNSVMITYLKYQQNKRKNKIKNIADKSVILSI